MILKLRKIVRGEKIYFHSLYYNLLLLFFLVWLLKLSFKQNQSLNTKNSQDVRNNN